MPDDQGRQRFAFTVHPDADRYPMISDDKLWELAADIKENGLDKPIKLDHTGEILVDGRNRLKACAIAGVEPKFERLPESTDLKAYIVSANLQRRHLTPGQQAIALALAYPEAPMGRGAVDPALKSATSADFSVRSLQAARQIVRYSPDLAKQVFDGTLEITHALAEARWRKQHAEEADEYLRQLQTEAPELAGAVSSGDTSLYSAWMEHRGRQRARAADFRQLREALIQGLQRVHVAWTPRMRGDQGFRAGLIAILGVEPERVEAYLDALDALVAAALPEEC